MFSEVKLSRSENIIFYRRQEGPSGQTVEYCLLNDADSISDYVTSTGWMHIK